MFFAILILGELPNDYKRDFRSNGEFTMYCNVYVVQYTVLVSANELAVRTSSVSGRELTSTWRATFNTNYNESLANE